MHRPEGFVRAVWIHPSGFIETSRDCVPGDESRQCDCNRRKGICHCSDNDCGWDPRIVHCTCVNVDIGRPS